MTELEKVGPGLGLIVPSSSGTTFTNQCGGHASLHLQLEGDYVLLRHECVDLIVHFWLVVGGYSWSGLTQKDADEVDASLADYGLKSAMRVDRSKLSHSYGAWVWVITKKISTDDPVLKQVSDGIGVLTWDDAASTADRIREEYWERYVKPAHD